MDNICHTLVGAAMAHAGLKQRTAYASGTLMIAANIPDLDALAYVATFVTDVSPVAFRRGWTHGVVGQALLPVALTVAVVAWARWRGHRSARPAGLKPRPTSESPPVRAGWLLALSYLALYSHLFLDFLNNYGVRLLAPLEWRWFYGDAVFIVDPWLWLALGAGLWAARRKRMAQPAAVALGAAAGYVLAMLGSAAVSREAVIREWRAARGYDPSALMVGPVPVSPFSRQVIVDAGDHYETGIYRFWSPRLRLDPDRIPKNEGAPEVAAARAAPAVRNFLVWSRFPFWQIRRTDSGTEVTVRDVRFPIGDGTFMARVVVPERSKSSRTEPK
jgi:inner membrane protein